MKINIDNKEQVLDFLSKWTNLDGVFLKKKVVVTDAITINSLIVQVDIKSSFNNNEDKKIKNYLKSNGFQVYMTPEYDYAYVRKEK